MANCMAKVAEALGVELGEVFRIEDWDLELHDYFKITEKGFYKSSRNDPYKWKPAPNFMLLLTGEIELTKIPWKPSYGDTYYIPFVVNADKYKKLFWLNLKGDEIFYQWGLVYRTKEEAIKLAEEMLDVVRKGFAGDI